MYCIRRDLKRYPDERDMRKILATIKDKNGITYYLVSVSHNAGDATDPWHLIEKIKWESIFLSDDLPKRNEFKSEDYTWVTNMSYRVVFQTNEEALHLLRTEEDFH